MKLCGRFSAVYKMCRFAKPHPFVDPFERLVERTLLRFSKRDGSVVRARLPDVSGQWNKLAHKDLTRLYAIEDLGRRANGRVWLTCTKMGAVCVIKFSIDKNPSDALEKEHASLARAYPKMKVYLFSLTNAHPS